MNLYVSMLWLYFTLGCGRPNNMYGMGTHWIYITLGYVYIRTSHWVAEGWEHTFQSLHHTGLRKADSTCEAYVHVSNYMYTTS